MQVASDGLTRRCTCSSFSSCSSSRRCSSAEYMSIPLPARASVLAGSDDVASVSLPIHSDCVKYACSRRSSASGGVEITSRALPSRFPRATSTIASSAMSGPSSGMRSVLTHTASVREG